MGGVLFKKGEPRHPLAGRKKGTLNKGRVAKVSEKLLEKCLDPVEELLKLLPEMEAKEQAKVWMDLLSYTQAKAKETDPEHDNYEDKDLTINDILDLTDVTPVNLPDYENQDRE